MNLLRLRPIWKILISLLAFSLIAGACTSLPASQASSDSENELSVPSLTPPQAPLASPTLKSLEQIVETPPQQTLSAPQPSDQLAESPASRGVLSACIIDDQASAMQADHIPDWESLDLSACYDLTLNLDVDADIYDGSAEITFANLTGTELNDLVFRTFPTADAIYDGDLSITSAAVDGNHIEPEIFLPDNTAVRLPLKRQLPAGETALIELEFTGQYTVNFGDKFGVYGIFNYVKDDQVLTLANWYPLLAPWRNGSWDVDPVIGIGDAVVSKTSLYRVRLTAPSGWRVVTSGSVVLQEQVDGRARWSFVSGPARDFIIIASPNFVLREAQAEAVRIRHWGLSDGKARWDEALQAAVDAVTLFNERYGPYPYRELDVVAVPLTLAAGVEYPGVFLIDDSQYETDAQSPFLLGIVISHEAAHQWWYGVVGNDVLVDPWLDEALATFSSLLYQQVYQPRYYQGTLRFYRNRVAEIDETSRDSSVDQPLAEFRNRPGEYSPIVYTKGALFFVELREMLGDQVFFSALGSYYSQNKYQIAAPEELLAAFEASCECQLDDVYSDWGIRP